jgi:hypothetical protein
MLSRNFNSIDNNVEIVKSNVEIGVWISSPSLECVSF